jgi:hypothetical protein
MSRPLFDKEYFGYRETQALGEKREKNNQRTAKSFHFRLPALTR